MTSGGFGNTTWTIWASSPTVARISLNNSCRPFSVLGGVESGSLSVFHLCKLWYEVRKERPSRDMHLQFRISVKIVYSSDSVYEEIVLIDVYLNA